VSNWEEHDCLEQYIIALVDFLGKKPVLFQRCSSMFSNSRPQRGLRVFNDASSHSTKFIAGFVSNFKMVACDTEEIKER
jgi:hypothetical protein